MSVTCMAASGSPLPDHYDGRICIRVGRLQPDLVVRLVLVSHSLWKIVIVVVTRSMDGSSEQLTAAHERKMCTYAPLLEVLQAYHDEGWQVEIFLWVVGA